MPERPLRDAHAAGPHVNVREEALALLLRIVKGGGDSVPLPALLAQISERRQLLPVQQAFLSELTYGVLRLCSLLDLSACTFIPRPEKLSAMMRMLLRISAYEMLFMKRIPCRATVDECVSIAKRRFGSRAAGFFNAVLRRMSEDAPRMMESIHDRISHVNGASPPGEISFCASIPLWLAERWSEHYGAAAAAMLARGLIHAPMACWRVNTAREGWRGLLEEWLSLGWERSGSHGFFSSFSMGIPHEMQGVLWQRLAALEMSGAISRQGSHSQIVAETIADRMRRFRGGNARLWDCCCGRGGKTAALAEQGVRICLASDPSHFRLEDLRKQFCRLGIPCPPVFHGTAQEISGMRFEAILVDAPCSGTGTLARNPELKYRLSPQMLCAASSLQKSILDSVWQNLLPGGLLFYSTCSLEPSENELQVRRFAALHCGASVESLRTYLPCSPGQDSLFLSVLRKDA